MIRAWASVVIGEEQVDGFGVMCDNRVNNKIFLLFWAFA